MVCRNFGFWDKLLLTVMASQCVSDSEAGFKRCLKLCNNEKSSSCFRYPAGSDKNGTFGKGIPEKTYGIPNRGVRDGTTPGDVGPSAEDFRDSS